MIVIARNNGPIYNMSKISIAEYNYSVGRRGLKEGKSYTVIQWSYQKPLGNWINETKDFINPKEPKFFIRVINEDGIEYDYWNDYFLSSEEMRDYKIDKILK